jgi:hypothetical protein
MQSVATTLGSLLSERSSQIGAYSILVIPSLSGTAATSAALCLDDGRDDWMAAGATSTTAPAIVGGARGSSAPLAFSTGAASGGGGSGGIGGGPAAHAAQRSVFEHSRWFAVDAEEHHLVSGPDVGRAGRLFAEGVVGYVVQLHQHSLHLVLGLEVEGKRVWGVGDLLQDSGRKVRRWNVGAEACWCASSRQCVSVCLACM